MYCREPWGEDRRDLAAGTQIMHQVAAAGINPRQPADYMPYLKRQAEQQTQSEEEMKATWDEICRAAKAAEESRFKTEPLTPNS